MQELRAFLNKYYKKDIEATIETAEDAIKKEFIFNQRWDMEKTYVKEKFDGPIDFMHQPGDDPEWVYAFNRLKHFISLGQAYILTGDEKYASCFSYQAEHWIESVKSTDERCKKAWRTIESGIRLDTLTKSYLMMKETKSFRRIESKFLKSIKEHAAFILKNSWDSYHLMSNWGVLSNHGLYVASCVFDEEEWRKEALSRLSKELWNQIYDDGVQWEQSPMYHNEVLKDYLDVILFSKLYGHRLDPAFVEKVHKAALVNMKWVKPNGAEPMMGDSDDIDMRDILTYSAYVFNDGNLKAVGYKHLDYETSFIVGIDGIREFEILKAKYPEETDYFLSDSGNAIARTGWKKDDSYLRFHNGTLGAGHGHADQGHISFAYKGKDFLVDAGRYTYVFDGGRKDFKDNHCHNVAIVDGVEVYPGKDSWECYSLDKAVNTRAALKGNAIAFEGAHLAYLKRGVYANRKVVWIKDAEMLFVIDEFYANENHSYEQIFHFDEDISLAVEKSIAKAGKCQITSLATGKIKLEKRKSLISRHYNIKEENEALIIKTENAGFTSIVTLFDFKEDKAKLKRLKVSSNFKGITFADDTIEAFEAKSKERDIVLVVAHKEYATPTDTFSAGGCVGFGQLTVFDKAKGEKEIGKRLFF